MKNIVKILLFVFGVCSTMGTAKPKASPEIDWSGETWLDVSYKEIGGRRMLMDIYMPSDGEPVKRPVIYYTHGGGWAAGSKEKFGDRLVLPVFRQLAEKGFVCVSIDYRLCKKGSGVLMRDCVTDAMDGLRFLKKNEERYGIDSDRIVVWGDSAGGQMAQMLIYADHKVFSGDKALVGYDVRPIAGISWYGPSDFTDVGLFKTNLSEKDPDRFGLRITGTEGGYSQHTKAYEEMSPYYWIAEKSPPLLLLQGDADATIPLGHAPHLKAKADRIGADVKMVIIKNAGHNWRSAGGDPEPGVEEIQRLTAEYAWERDSLGNN